MALETIYRQKAFHRLNETQKQAKLAKDSEYKIAVDNLTVSWKKGEITWEAYRQQKSVLWNTLRDWAISQDLYEEVTPEQQLTEAEAVLNDQVEGVNIIRQELGQKPIEVKEKAIEAL